MNIVRLTVKSERLGFIRYSCLGIVSRKYNAVYDVSEVSTREELDFLLARSFCYVRRMFQSFCICFSKYWCSGKLYRPPGPFPKPFSDYKVDIWPEREFINFFTLTGACHYLKYDNNRKFYTLSAREVENFVLFQNHYLEFREIRFTLNEILSITIGNKVIVKSKASAADWCRILLCKYVDKFRVSYSITFRPD